MAAPTAQPALAPGLARKVKKVGRLVAPIAARVLARALQPPAGRLLACDHHCTSLRHCLLSGSGAGRHGGCIPLPPLQPHRRQPCLRSLPPRIHATHNTHRSWTRAPRRPRWWAPWPRCLASMRTTRRRRADACAAQLSTRGCRSMRSFWPRRRPCCRWVLGQTSSCWEAVPLVLSAMCCRGRAGPLRWCQPQPPHNRHGATGGMRV